MTDYRHVVVFDSDKPNAKVKSITTYSRLKDVISPNEPYRLITGSKKELQNIPESYATYTIHVVDRFTWGLSNVIELMNALGSDDIECQKSIDELKAFFDKNEFGTYESKDKMLKLEVSL